jgi:two-component system, chemotaxis family, sensor kinase CheA
MNDLDLTPAFEAFRIEGRELVAELEQGLLRLEQGHDRGDAELVNAMFRAAHTIKGSAGILGINGLGRFTHHVETLLDRVRAGEPLLSDDMVSRLLACCDHMAQLLDLSESGDLEGRALEAAGARLLAALDAPGEPTAAEPAGGTDGAPATGPVAEATEGFRLWLVCARDTLRDGIDPAAALQFLGERCTLDAAVAWPALVPALDSLDPEDCVLALALRARSGSVQQAADAFEFFGDGTTLALCEAGADANTVYARLAPLRERLGDDALQPWRDAGLITEAEWLGKPAATSSAVSAASTLSAAPAAATPACASTPAAASEPAKPGHPVAPPARSSHTPPAPARFVRVPADRLDELILQVGELVIAGAGVDVLARQVRHTRLQEAVGQLAALIDTIQSATLQLRMVPIGETFNRFQRVVRDVAHELGKDIALEIVGGDTELDKAMVERIGDPLMHLVRNAMDHGLETPEQRQATGKPAQGTLRLRAFHDSGNVVIEVSDDGRGLDRERIVAKAQQRGLIGSSEGLSDHEVYQLIFEPGFSTAEQVTSLSGRGVGMDVVKRSVESLRGTITLHSRPGQGALVQLRLPLTLAIIDGFMVQVADSRFIVPLDLVVECIELPAGALQAGAPRYLNLRGEVLPYVCLRQAFGLGGSAPKRPSVVVVRSGEVKTGLLVDALHGEIQTVIKPMSRLFRRLQTISGTSILGSGDIALILDAHQLVQRSVDRALRHSAV